MFRIHSYFRLGAFFNFTYTMHSPLVCGWGHFQAVAEFRGEALVYSAGATTARAPREQLQPYTYNSCSPLLCVWDGRARLVLVLDLCCAWIRRNGLWISVQVITQ